MMLINLFYSAVLSEETLQSTVRRTARKSICKPVIVSNKPIGSGENMPTSKVVINTKELQSKHGATQIKEATRMDIDRHHEEDDYEDEEDHVNDNDFAPENEHDESDSNSEHASVLREERTMYRVKTQKLRLQIRHLQNDNEMHELEKEKLKLEIRLLEMQVDEKESELEGEQSQKQVPR